ncbi:predicted protein [Uncinocarpus reesii 1704]|uniref:Uncharacterized protein n=1 Tax=Uncinocarpus reesii (strain UAMH 1704) TaxID=336963 RepID=C4JFC6_UNCRE|nr:uncharacterized protein UREG_02348 [Uncinocarpus reesii 1704]EEP77499.1 predicted protein [Uncinocarpus reesii 1704]
MYALSENRKHKVLNLTFETSASEEQDLEQTGSPTSNHTIRDPLALLFIKAAIIVARIRIGCVANRQTQCIDKPPVRTDPPQRYPFSAENFLSAPPLYGAFAVVLGFA